MWVCRHPCYAWLRHNTQVTELDHMVSLFMLRGLWTHSHSGCTSSHSRQCCARLPLLASQPQECLLFSCFQDDRHSDWEEMESQCCIDLCSLMAKDVKHVFTYLLVICTSFENCLFSSFVHLLIGPFVLLVNLFDISWVLYSGLS